MDWILASRLSTSASWSLIARSQPFTPPRLLTRVPATSFAQIFLASAAVASAWRFEIVCATARCSPVKPAVYTVLPHAARATAQSGTLSGARTRLAAELDIPAPEVMRRALVLLV